MKNNGTIPSPPLARSTLNRGVIVAPEIAGTVTEIAFESGTSVNKGDLAAGKLDDSSGQAQLRALAAEADLMRLTAERTRKLHMDGTASQSELDQAEASLKQADANADNIRATIAKKKISAAPFTGQLGIRRLSEPRRTGRCRQGHSSRSRHFPPCSLILRCPRQRLGKKLAVGLGVHVTSDTVSWKTI